MYFPNMERHLDPKQNSTTDDWVGNNAAFTCDKCGKVYLVSGLLHKNGRACPQCGQTKAFATGGRNSGGTAFISWDS